jgi:hypothetical protein
MILAQLIAGQAPRFSPSRRPFAYGSLLCQQDQLRARIIRIRVPSAFSVRIESKGIPELAFITSAIAHKGGSDAIAAKGGNESRCLPMTVRDLGIKPLAAPAASMHGRQVGLRPGLVNEHETLRIEELLPFPPARPLGRDVRPILLGGIEDFF